MDEWNMKRNQTIVFHRLWYLEIQVLMGKKLLMKLNFGLLLKIYLWEIHKYEQLKFHSLQDYSSWSLVASSLIWKFKNLIILMSFLTCKSATLLSKWCSFLNTSVLWTNIKAFKYKLLATEKDPFSESQRSIRAFLEGKYENFAEQSLFSCLAQPW